MLRTFHPVVRYEDRPAVRQENRQITASETGTKKDVDTQRSCNGQCLVWSQHSIKQHAESSTRLKLNFTNSSDWIGLFNFIMKKVLKILLGMRHVPGLYSYH